MGHDGPWRTTPIGAARVLATRRSGRDRRPRPRCRRPSRHPVRVPAPWRHLRLAPRVPAALPRARQVLQAKARAVTGLTPTAPATPRTPMGTGSLVPGGGRHYDDANPWSARLLPVDPWSPIAVWACPAASWATTRRSLEVDTVHASVLDFATQAPPQRRCLRRRDCLRRRLARAPSEATKSWGRRATARAGARPLGLGQRRGGSTVKVIWEWWRPGRLSLVRALPRLRGPATRRSARGPERLQAGRLVTVSDSGGDDSPAFSDRSTGRLAPSTLGRASSPWGCYPELRLKRR